MNYIHTSDGESILYDGDFTDSQDTNFSNDIEEGELPQDDLDHLYQNIVTKSRDKFIQSCDPSVQSYWHVSPRDFQLFMRRFTQKYICRYGKVCRYDKKVCKRIHTQSRDVNVIWRDLNMIKKGNTILDIPLTEDIPIAIQERWGSRLVYIQMRDDIFELCILKTK